MNKAYKKFSKLIMALLLLTLPVSCDLDINDDPNNPVDAPLPLLLSSGQASFGFAFSQVTGGFNNAASVFAHQMVNFRVDQYLIDGNTFSNDWIQLYSRGLKDLDVVIEKGVAEEAFHYVGVAQILQSFAFGAMVDLWGDVPYFEALSDNFAPAYDDGRSIYEDLFVKLGEAKQNLNAVSSLSPSGDDIFYNGDLEKWERLANTLLLKLYLNVRLTDLYNQGAVEALVSEGMLFRNQFDDFQFNFGTGLAPENRNVAFQTNWASPSREMFISPFFYERMRDLSDPRIPYYWFNQIGPGGTAQNPTDYEDDSDQGLFVSTRFGAVGPNANFAQQNSQSLLGLYPAGGAYNNAVGGTGSGSSAPGNAPDRLLTYYALQFMLAELALETSTNVGGVARDFFEEGMVQAFNKVNEVVVVVGGAPLLPQDQVDAYINLRLVQFDAADDRGKLALILEEKATASFGWAVDSYNDIRRTGLPEIYDPNADGDDNTQSERSFPVSFTYVLNELAANPNAPDQRIPAEDRVFWDIN
jgi:hypothetical protein